MSICHLACTSNLSAVRVSSPCPKTGRIISLVNLGILCHSISLIKVIRLGSKWSWPRAAALVMQLRQSTKLTIYVNQPETYPLASHTPAIIFKPSAYMQCRCHQNTSILSAKPSQPWDGILASCLSMGYF